MFVGMNRARILRRHNSDRLGEIGIVADKDPECQAADRKDRNPIAGFINGSIDGRVELPIDSDDSSVLKHGRGVVEPVACSLFRTQRSS